MSTLLQFRKVEATSRFAKVLLLGEAGAGKSHAALTFPKPAVVDAEGSSDWFADRFAFDAVATKSYADVRDLVRSVRSSKGKYETIVIDSLTTIYSSLVNAATEARLADKYPSEDLRPLDWGRIKRKFSSLLDELYHQLPMHVVCVGWVKAEYAKPGDVVDGDRVKKNDLVKVGEVFDGDKKATHAFDFIFKITGNDGKRTTAEVVKSRSGALKKGQKIADFSFETIRALLPSGKVAPAGMTDEQQATRDAKVFESHEDEEPTHLAVDAATAATYASQMTLAAQDLEWSGRVLCDFIAFTLGDDRRSMRGATEAEWLAVLDGLSARVADLHAREASEEPPVGEDPDAPLLFHPSALPEGFAEASAAYDGATLEQQAEVVTALDPHERQLKALRQDQGKLATTLGMTRPQRQLLMRRLFPQTFADEAMGEESSKMLSVPQLDALCKHLGDTLQKRDQKVAKKK